MKKRFSKFLALALALVMIVTAMPVSAMPFSGIGNSAVDRDKLETARPERPNNPAQTFSAELEGGLQVTVEAPYGALPEGTQMNAVRVDRFGNVQAAIDFNQAVDGSVIAAADITFMHNGEEVQPAVPVNVTMRCREFAHHDDLFVAHLPFSVDEIKRAIPVVDEITDFEADDDVVSFSASDFSIYLVGEGSDEHTITITFYEADGQTVINKQIIRSSQVANDPVYDPGVPSINDTQAFEGWAMGTYYEDGDERWDVELINDYIKTHFAGITENVAIEFTAMVFDVAFVTYHDQNGAIIKLDSAHLENGRADYTVDFPYNPTSTGFGFVDWVDAIESMGANPTYPAAAHHYPNGAHITLNGNIDLYPYVRSGSWLIFDNNIDSSIDDTKATYTEPSFVPDGEASYVNYGAGMTAPQRPGYTFGGWYLDQACTQQLTIGSPIDSFVGSDRRLTVYAKWVPATANYNVVFWIQKITDTPTTANANKKYDFWKVETRTAATASNVSINTSNSGTTADNRLGYNSANSIGELGYYFTYNGTNTDTGTVRVKGDGSATLNVYYDRKTITFNFGTGTLQYYSVSNPDWSSGKTYYVRSGSSYLECFKTSAGYYYTEYTGSLYTSTTYYIIYNDSIYSYSYNSNYDDFVFYVSGDGYYTWSGTVYTRSTSAPSGTVYEGRMTLTNTTKTITGLYGSFLASGAWPNAGSGYTWSNYDESDGTVYQYPMALSEYVPTWLNAETDVLDFYKSEYDTNVINVYNVGQPLNGTGYTITLASGSVSKGGKWYPTETIHGFTIYGYRFGTTGSWTECDRDSIIEVSESETRNLYVAFKRNTNEVVFISNNEEVTPQGIPSGFNIKAIPYETPLSSLANVVPTNAPEGCYFDGWYADASCTKEFDFSVEMPDNNISVYAKWTPMRFRVILDPTGGDASANVHFATQAQKTAFRLDYGELLGSSGINSIIREGYTLAGWFYDKNGQYPFSFDTPITEETRNMDMTYGDDLTSSERQGVDAWNNNQAWFDNDGENDDVRGKLVLYALWSKNAVGGTGVRVRYDAIEGEGHFGQAPDTYIIRDDPNIYADQARAYAQVASTPDDAETRQFLYWVVMRPDAEGNLVPTDIKVYPGQTFVVSMEYAVQTEACVTNWIWHGGSDKTSTSVGSVPSHYAPASYIEGNNYYTFDHWDPTPTACESGQTYTFNAVYTSQPVSQVTVTATWMNGSVQLAQTQHAPGSVPVYTGATPTKEEDEHYTYVFDGWTIGTGTTVYTAATLPAITDSTTYYAHFAQTAKTYTVTFNANGGTGAPAAATNVASGTAFGDVPGFFNPPTYEGYTFVGWFDSATGSNEISDTTAVTADITLYAHWVAVAVETWYPVSSIVPGEEYLIGFKSGNNVYLAVNYNANNSSHYYYPVASSSDVYYGYTALATLDGTNVIGATGNATDLQYCTWIFSDTTGGTMQSGYESDRYLRGYNADNDLYVGTTAQEWTYSSTNKTISRSISGSTVYMAYYSGNSTNLMRAVTSTPSSTIQLYSRTPEVTWTQVTGLTSGTGYKLPEGYYLRFVHGGYALTNTTGTTITRAANNASDSTQWWMPVGSVTVGSTTVRKLQNVGTGKFLYYSSASSYDYASASASAGDTYFLYAASSSTVYLDNYYQASDEIASYYLYYNTDSSQYRYTTSSSTATAFTVYMSDQQYGSSANVQPAPEANVQPAPQANVNTNPRGPIVPTAANTLLTENFDSMSSISTTYSGTGWYAYNAGSGNNWTLNSSSSYANSGSNSAQVKFNSSYAANCYLVSAPFTVDSDATDLTLSLYECVRSSSYAETFEAYFVKASALTNASSVTSATKYNAISSADYTNTTYAQKTGSVSSSNLSALKGQSVRLVIHCTSIADRYYLYIDDITVTETTGGGSSTPTTEMWVPTNTITPNEDYLIGMVVDGVTYLAVNYNESATNHYYLQFATNSSYPYYREGYTGVATLDSNGNVVSVSGAATDLSYCTWRFSSSTGGTITSVYNSDYKLYLTRTGSSSSYIYWAAPNTTGSTFTYDASNHILYSSSYYLADYAHSDNNHYLDLATSSGSAAYIQLFHKETVTTYTVNAVSGNTSNGTVAPASTTAMANGSVTFTATPATGYGVSSVTVSPSSAATATFSGNTITVSNVTANCTVTVNFAALAQYTVTYVADGTQVGTDTTYSGYSVTLPATAPALSGYEFFGWVTSTLEETLTRPTYYAPGAQSPAITADTTFYALYRRTAGSSYTAYVLVTSELSDWAGRYVISYGKTAADMVVMHSVTGSTDGTTYEDASSGGAVLFANTGITLNGNELTNVTNPYVFTFAAVSGGYSIRNVSNSAYLGRYVTTTSQSAQLRSYSTYSSTYCRWTPAYSTLYGNTLVHNVIPSNYDGNYPYLGADPSTPCFWVDGLGSDNTGTPYSIQLWKETTVSDYYYTTGVERHTLTINYEYEDHTTAAPTHTESVIKGASYSVASPVITGYTPSQTTVSGTMGSSDVTVTVTYTKNTHTLTITYVYAGGGTAAATHTETVAYGDSYSVTSPTVTGYTPDQAVVSGTMGDANVNVTVTYTKNTHTLTITYVMADGTTAPAAHTETVAYGDNYSVTSPTVTGYTPDQAVVSGTMGDADVNVTVTYTKNAPTTHTLTITYVMADGTTAPAAHVEQVAEGASYSVTSPTVSGYTPDQPVVSGVMGTSNVNVTVTYTKNTTPDPTTPPQGEEVVTYELVEAPEDGEEYVIVIGSKAVGNTVYSSNHYLTAYNVTVNSDNTLTVAAADAPKVLWTANGSTANGWTFYNEEVGKYMGFDSNEYLYPSDTALVWLYDGTDLNNQIDSAGYYYLGLASGNNCFTTSTGTGKNVKFYKKVVTYVTPEETYTVVFKDWDGTVLKTESNVPLHGSVTPPTDPTREGWSFAGWDRVDFDDVTGDMIVTATYVQEGTVTYTMYLYAVYGDKITDDTTTIRFNANGLNFASDAQSQFETLYPSANYPNRVMGEYQFSLAKLENNSHLTLPGEEIFEEAEMHGYHLIGWNTMPDGSGEDFAFDQVAYMDNLDKSSVNTHANTLYAMWEGYSYVYHSSDNDLDTFLVESTYRDAETTDTLNLVSLTAEKTGYLYAGYSTSYYGGALGSTRQIKWASDNYTASVQSGTKTYDPSKAYAYGFTKWWKTEEMATENGRRITDPKVGSVYYVKQVDNQYLRPRFQYIYDKHNENKIMKMFALTAIDDQNYTTVGFIIGSEWVEAEVAGSFSFTYESGEKITTKVKDFPGLKLGYVGYVDCGLPTDADGYIIPIAEENGISVNPYWITPDGVRVRGVFTRTFWSTDGTTGGLGNDR